MASMEEKFRNELNAHIKLSNLYKVRGTYDRRGYLAVWCMQSIEVCRYPMCSKRAGIPRRWHVLLVRCSQGAAADSEFKSEELTLAMEELHKLLKEAGEGERSSLLQSEPLDTNHVKSELKSIFNIRCILCHFSSHYICNREFYIASCNSRTWSPPFCIEEAR